MAARSREPQRNAYANTDTDTPVWAYAILGYADEPPSHTCSSHPLAGASKTRETHGNPYSYSL